MKKTGIINKIIPFSNVDGPGNRTAVFFQGCNLSCLFCHNPETIQLCRGCACCTVACPAGALKDRGDGGDGSFWQAPIVWDPLKCTGCDTCIRICPYLASPKVRLMTPGELAEEIRKTAPYINGVSFSGGECTLQREFLTEAIPRIRDLGLGVLLDSNGSYDFEQDPQLLEMIDGVMLDIKGAQPDFCRALTGRGPKLPLKNLEFLQEVGKLEEVRTVLFAETAPLSLPGGQNWSAAEMNEQTVQSVAAKLLPGIRYKLLRYRPFGVRQEGLDFLGNEIPSEEYAERLAKLARSLGAEGCVVV